MATPEVLIRDGLRAYERGRLGVASRLAWLVVPAVSVCFVSTGAKDVTCCLGVLLLAGAVYLRWRDRAGVRAAYFGVSFGLGALLVGLLLASLSPWWLALNGLAGVGTSVATRRARLSATDAAQSTVLASLAAGLGCAGAPAIILAAAMAAVVVGGVIGRGLRSS